MAPPSSHIRKRQFQPSITSYFNHDGCRSTLPLSPPLPEETQASLLSVGMRVRKSVPEGYKTHKTLNTAWVPDPSSAPLPVTVPPRSSPQVDSSRELIPFCGLFKVGGWAAQELPPSTAPARFQCTNAAMDKEGSEEASVPAFSMSQSTLQSSQNSSASYSTWPEVPSRKRTYEDEAEAGMDAFFDEAEDVDISDPQTSSEPVRRIAKLRSSLRTVNPIQEQVSIGDQDFEEAPFLAPMEVDR